MRKWKKIVKEGKRLNDLINTGDESNQNQIAILNVIFHIVSEFKNNDEFPELQGLAWNWDGLTGQDIYEDGLNDNLGYADDMTVTIDGYLEELYDACDSDSVFLAL